MFAIGFYNTSIVASSIAIGRGRKVVEVYGGINLSRFCNAIWSYICKKGISVRAISGPVKLRFPVLAFAGIDLERVAEVK